MTGALFVTRFNDSLETGKKFFKQQRIFTSWRLQHILHCVLMLLFMVLSTWLFAKDIPSTSPLWSLLGSWPTCFFYFIRFVSVFIALPYDLFIFVGLFFFDAFPDPVPIRDRNFKNYPFICFSVATRGESKKLVRSTVSRNLKIIRAAGVRNFKLQVLTNVFIEGLAKDSQVEQMVVPSDYETKTGALYKARSLQYAIDTDTSMGDRDWILHLDEETLLTPNSLAGILNFVKAGKHQFGQGLITYSNDGVQNWLTTLADGTRIADDMGKIRAQFRLLHRPIFSMKGAYTVAQVGAERVVGYEFGPNGSIAEDCWFVMKAYDMGFTFDFIDGEMWEFSPFTLWDFVLQRKRWFQGILLVVYTSPMRLSSLIWLTLDFHNHFFQPLQVIFVVVDWWEVLPVPIWLQILALPCYGLRLYMYVFGIIKSAHCAVLPEQKRPMDLFFQSLFAMLIVRPIQIAMQILACFLGLWCSKHGFYLVKKEI